ncbi:MAG: helix-turn-helix transcriptional regulator [Anaerolineales bacterium]|nr:helix-turn-helix transcriptional regulator [Anaerolineales bacterium]
MFVAASITPREQQVLQLLRAYLSNQEIAEQCSISSSTEQTHMAYIYRKLGVNSRMESTAHVRMPDLVQSGFRSTFVLFTFRCYK